MPPKKNKTLFLTYQNLSRRYGAEWALKEASGELFENEIVALEGENGSGKSTLLLTLAGILRPHKGAIAFHNTSAHLVAHHPMAYIALSIERNLALAHAIDKNARHSLDATMEFWQIAPLKAKALSSLSRGQMQRFLLARSMLTSSRVLLLDEPFTGLDVHGEKLLEEFIRSEAARGVAVLFSDHDHARAQKLATRTIRMKAGRCIS
ncbi:MAG TPA: ATP-binding cassette domain-containing protein [Turneriella sp.]|nr:ATP-binding cassette domain-containing protein [Turneriella sp.]